MLAGCGGGERLGRPPGALYGLDLAARGHLARDGGGPRGGDTTAVDVLIVGAAGLAAAWRLRGGGFRGSVRLVDLGNAPGGTALSGAGERGPFPWGAHYLTMPGPGLRHLRRLLHELGVITGFEGGGPDTGRPRYADDAVCLAPDERLFVAGRWIEGLWPEPLATAADRAGRDAFLAEVAAFRARVGADGRPAFTLPVAACSRDPGIRALAERSFADWLDERGYTGEVLRWWLTYGCRDDYGTTLETTSAWAGLHYHCARAPDPADAQDLGTDVLTWPAGNGWLVDRLAAGCEIETALTVVQVEPEGRVYGVASDGAPRAWQARAVVLAVPAAVADRLVGRAVGEPRPDAAPWRVAQVQVSERPRSHGVPTAWDSVLYGAPSLGYVTSTHQLGLYRGPAVLTWYEALTGEPAAERRALADTSWEAEVDRVLAELRPAHPELDGVVERVDSWAWGHGTVRPVPGLHRPGRLEALAAPLGRVHFAHTDLSGLSLFEEASWHGVRAAEEVLAALGPAPTESWR